MRKLILATLLAAPLASFAAGNLVTNGSFESNLVAPGTFTIYNGTSVTGWTANTEIEIRNNDVGTAFDGVNFVELDANHNNSMSTSFATTAGMTYTLSFEYSNRPGTAVSTNGLDFSVGGLTASTGALAANTSSDNIWTLYSTTFTATAATTTLTFSSTGTSDSYGTSLDNVVVTTAVPEPGTYALMLAGLGAIGFVARRRRNA